MSCKPGGSFSNTNSSPVVLSIASHGKMMNLFRADPLYHKRIELIGSSKRRRGLANTLMTMTELSQTHYCLFHNTWQPFLLMVSDQTVTNAIGNTDYDQVVEFVLPETGDYSTFGTLFYETPDVRCTAANLEDITVYSKYPEVNTLNSSRPLNFGASTLGLPNTPAVIPDGQVYVMDALNVPQPTIITRNGKEYTILPGDIRYTYTNGERTLLAGPDGTASFPDANGFGTGALLPRVQASNFVRAVRFPGIKLFSESNFLVDSKPIEEYEDTAVLNNLLYNVPNNIKPVMYKLYGEDIGHYEKNNSQNLLGKAFGGLTGPDALDTNAHNVHIFDGLQTPKALHHARQMLVTLPFNFSVDPSQALCTAALPDVEKKVQVKVVALDEIFRPTFGDLYIHEQVTFRPSTAGVLDVTTPFNRIIETSRLIPYYIPGSVLEKDCCCKSLNMKLITTSLYVDENLHNMSVQKVGFTPYRLPVMQKRTITADISSNSGDEKDMLLSSSRWPTEWMIVRVIPCENRRKESHYYPDNWFEDLFVCNYLEYFSITDELDNEVAPGPPPVIEYVHRIKSVRTYIRSRKTPTLRTMGLSILSYDIYPNQPINYYKDLAPYNRGKENFQADFHENIAPIIAFQYKLFNKQPDNLCNFSKAREAYLHFGINCHDCRNVNKCHPCSCCYVSDCCSSTCFVVIIHFGAYNFLLTVGGTQVKRYS